MKSEHESQKSNDIIRKIKEWAAPILFIGLSTLIWRDISELRTDVKTLLAQANGDKVRIEKVESDVMFLKNQMFSNKKPLISQSVPDGTTVDMPDFGVYALKNDENYTNLMTKIKQDEI